MCGIVYHKSFQGKAAFPTIIKRFKAQRGRGVNGFGFYTPENNRLTHNTREGRILRLLKRGEESEILFHHRWPTSTENVRNSCHPFSTKSYFEHNYVVVHNGVLYNEHALKREHEEMGIKYISEQLNGRFNDSEALTYDIARYLEGQTDALSARGSIAFIAVQRDKEGKALRLFFARNWGSPLKMKKTELSLTISSEGEGDIVPPDTLYCFNYDTKELSKRDCDIPSNSWQGQGYTPPINPHTSYEPGLEDDELLALEDSWELEAEVREVKQQLLYHTGFDHDKAITEGKERLLRLQARQIVIDAKSEDEKTADSVTDDEVNEFIKNEDDITLYEEAIKQLEDLQGKGGAAAGRQTKFRYTPDHLRKTEDTKLLKEGRPFAD